MALNQFMHPRNIYKNRKPDFKELALKNAAFRAAVSQDLKGRIVLDFKNPRCLKALTCALLKEDFGVYIEIPENRLIPAVPQRLNYVLWLEDLIEAMQRPVDRDVRGLDIGTGSSCIYPLLGAKLNGWEFYASEVDSTNFKNATENVLRNQFQNKIKVTLVGTESVLKEVVSHARAALCGSVASRGASECEELFDFCMCNPPFFGADSDADIASHGAAEEVAESSCPVAADVERFADGGDEQFVKRMVDESVTLGRTIRLYTSMLGKKASLSKVKAYLREKGITNFSSTTFCQGRTMRWAIAWTFDSAYKFPKALTESQKQVQKDKKPLICLLSRSEGDERGSEAFTRVVQAVRDLLDELEMFYTIVEARETAFSATVTGKRNTWSHQRRKRRQQMRSDSTLGWPSAVPSAAKVLCSDGQAVAAGNASLAMHDDAGAGDAAVCIAGSSARSVTGDAAVPDSTIVPNLPPEPSAEQTGAVQACTDLSRVASCQTTAQSQAVLLRFVLTLTWVPGSGTALSMRWLEGQNRELMHQVMQFLKNHVSPHSQAAQS